MLASRLNTIHNLWYFSDFMRRMRVAIAEGRVTAFRDSFYQQQVQEQAGLTCVETDAAAEGE
jgi:queuine tRNA-ribosyltransferase